MLAKCGGKLEVAKSPWSDQYMIIAPNWIDREELEWLRCRITDILEGNGTTNE